MHGYDTYDYGARGYYPAIMRFTTIDPLAEKYYSISPYVYCMNNPIMYLDPDGMDNYRYDDKTGEFILMETTDDKFDQVLGYKFDKKSGEWQKNTKWYQTKTRISDIEKGILSNGVNFKEKDNVISVGRDGQPTVAGVENFIIELSEMVGKGIGGFEYSAKGETEIDNVYIGRFQSSKDRPSRWNTDQKAYAVFDPRVAGVMPNEVNFYVDFHTHLSSFSDDSKLQPSGRIDGSGDIGYKRTQQVHGFK